MCRGVGSKLPVSLTAYSVVGAAAYMGGATRMTLTTTVMVMETTGALQLIVPIMLTVFVAKVRQRMCDKHVFALCMQLQSMQPPPRSALTECLTDVSPAEDEVWS